MAEFRTVLVVLFLCHCAAGGLPQLHQVHSKFEYKHTFKGPHIITKKGIPFWDYGGSAIAGDESIRVCPSVKSRRGWVWSKNPYSADNWMIDITTKITGRLKTGADGMAIWFTEERGMEGGVYGNADLWKGLAIIMDSFDNDIQHDNPRIQLVLNDGTRAYDHRTDGKSTESGSCVIDFRNRPFPVKLRLTYLRGVFELWVHEGINMSEDDYQLCVKLEHAPELAYIPKNGYLGVTAATGGLSDDHDILSFITHTLTPLEALAAQARQVDQAKMDELSDQYSKMAEDFDRRRENAREDDDDVDWQKEVEFERSMRLVGDMQVALVREIRAVGTKLEQSSALGGSGSTATSMASDITHIKNTGASIQRSLAELRANPGTGDGAKGPSSEQLAPLYETKSILAEQAASLNNILAQLKVLSDAKCPAPAEASSCLSTWLFFVVIVTQLVVIIGYNVYTQAQERNAKKFF